MDELKEGIAISVQRQVRTLFDKYTDPDGTEFEVQTVSNTETVVRAKLPQSGTRWFKVKVSEMM